MVIIKFEWLKEYKQLEHEIALLEWKLSKSKLELTRWVEGDLMDVKLTNESLASKLEGVIAKLEEDLSIRKKQMDELMALVNKLDDVDQRIVKLRYVKGYTFEQIAEAMGYSVGHIRNCHSNIRKYISFIEKYQDDIHYYRSNTHE